MISSNSPMIVAKLIWIQCNGANHHFNIFNVFMISRCRIPNSYYICFYEESYTLFSYCIMLK